MNFHTRVALYQEETYALISLQTATKLSYKNILHTILDLRATESGRVRRFTLYIQNAREII